MKTDTKVKGLKELHRQLLNAYICMCIIDIETNIYIFSVFDQIAANNFEIVELI